MVYIPRAFTKQRNYIFQVNSMSNRRLQLALDLPADKLSVRVVRLLNVVVINVIVAVAIIPARLADWTT